MATPVVSFIISVYNGEQFLPECIAGINGQTFYDYEVIIVDDGSSDGTSDILSKWSKEETRVRVLRSENDGLTSALNLAISCTRGKYLARHDADDISSPFRLERQVVLLEANKDAVLAGSHAVDFVDAGSLISLYCPPDNPKFILETLHRGRNPLVHGSVIFRKEAFERLKEGYRFRYAQDYDLFLRMSSLGKLRVVPEALYGLRKHLLSIEINARIIRHHIWKLIKQIHGIEPMDPENKTIINSYKGTEPLWRVLEERIIHNAPVVSEDMVTAQHLMSMIGDNLEKNEGTASIACAIKAISTCPAWWKAWLSLPYALIGAALPNSVISRWRGKGNIISRYRRPCNVSTLNEIFNGHRHN